MNNNNKLQIQYINLKPSKSITDHLTKKLERDLNGDFGIHSLICNLSKQSAKGGEKYRCLLEVHLKLSGFAIIETGNDIYKIIEIISDKLHQKIHKMNDRISDINHVEEKADLTKDIPARELKELDVIKAVNDTGRLPILERKQYSDNSPIHTEEAIQLMEMANKQCFLYRNVDTGKYTAIYKLEGRNGYGMIEPKSA